MLISCNSADLPEEATTTSKETTPAATTPEETTPDEPFLSSQGLAYTVNDDGETCTITGIGTCSESDIYIGGYIDGYKVTAIGNNALSWNFDLTSVTIGDFVTSIGLHAFYNCSRITSVVLLDSVTTIGGAAFSGCRGLTSITIPDSVITVDDQAFKMCDALTSVTIPDSVTTIGNEAFAYCRSLTSVTIPDSVTTIGDSVFFDCSKLTSIVVDENNTAYQSINGNLYSKDGSILIVYASGKLETSFVIPDSITAIGDYAFITCTNLTSVTIPNSVTTIGDQAFQYCYALTSVTFANPNNWWITQDKNSTSGTPISAADLVDPEIAAQYLSLRYPRNCWYRSE